MPLCAAPITQWPSMQPYIGPPFAATARHRIAGKSVNTNAYIIIYIHVCMYLTTRKDGLNTCVLGMTRMEQTNGFRFTMQAPSCA